MIILYRAIKIEIYASAEDIEEHRLPEIIGKIGSHASFVLKKDVQIKGAIEAKKALSKMVQYVDVDIPEVPKDGAIQGKEEETR